MTILVVLPDSINMLPLFFLCRLFGCKAESLLQELSKVKFSEPLSFFPHSIFSLNASNDWGSRYSLWHSRMGGTADTLLKLLIKEKFRWESHLYIGHRESWQAQGTLHQVQNEMHLMSHTLKSLLTGSSTHLAAMNGGWWDTFFVLSPLRLPEIPWLASGSHDY